MARVLEWLNEARLIVTRLKLYSRIDMNVYRARAQGKNAVNQALI